MKCYKKEVLQVTYDNGASWSTLSTVKYNNQQNNNNNN